MIPREILKKIRQIEMRTNRIVVCVLAWLVLGITSVGYGATLPHEISINLDAGCGGWLKKGWLTITLCLESGEGIVFMVDTGAPQTILDDSLKSHLGKRLGISSVGFVGNRPQHAEIYSAPKLLSDGVPLLTGSNVVCTSLKRFKKHCRGILGMDCLQYYCVQLDFVAGKMRFLDSSGNNFADCGKMYPMVFSKVGPKKQFIYPKIQQTNFFGADTNLLIDTGCHVDGLVNKSETGKVIRAWLLSFLGCGRFHAGVWDGKEYSNLKVAPVDHANVLGLRFLARHLVTLDFPNQKMYLKQVCVGPVQERQCELRQNS